MLFSIDALYAGFADGLATELRPLALALPHVLGLAPSPSNTWSEVFNQRVTLEAPAMIAETLPVGGAEITRDAVFAHALSVIEAFGTDRIADGQVRKGPELLRLLEELRGARDTLLERVFPGSSALARAADAETEQAVREERSLLIRLGAATFQDYRRISLGKQAVGFPASIALAQRAGAGEHSVEQVRRALGGVWLALQFEDDAADWEDDWRRGQGAWAVSLARRRLETEKYQQADERPTEPDLIRRRVFQTRVLYSMLKSSRHQYRVARRYAGLLGADKLVRWAERRMARLDEMLPMERRFAGYVVRATKLAPWAAEVLT
jgi:hypothetical protein